jgi:hypothetical protein
VSARKEGSGRGPRRRPPEPLSRRLIRIVTLRPDPDADLPPGLRTCPECGEARGTSTQGRVSSCYCSGAVCEGCGAKERRPVSDYFHRRDGIWIHVPYFALMGHPGGTCPQTLGPRRWRIREPASEVRDYQEAVTRMTLDEMRRTRPAGHQPVAGDDGRRR